MRSIGSSILILGLVMASATAQQGPTQKTQNYFSTSANELNTTTIAINTTEFKIDVTTSKTTTNNTTTNENNNKTTNDNNGTTTIQPSKAQNISMAPMNPSPTPEDGKPTSTAIYTMSPKSSPPATKSSTSKETVPASAKPQNASDDTIGIIIVVVMIFAGIVLAAACYFTRKKARRYSVDLHSRPDDVHIPLSTVEPTDPVSQNGMQTFDSVETDTKEQQGLVAKPEGQEEPKAEVDESIVEPSPDPAAAAPSTDSSVDKTKEDIVEQPPAKPVEQSPEEKTDDEGIVSNKTLVESLKEPNENNSNNAAKDWKPNNISEVPLDNPV